MGGKEKWKFITAKGKKLTDFSPFVYIPPFQPGVFCLPQKKLQL